MAGEWKVVVEHDIESVNITKDAKVVFSSAEGPALEKQLTPEDEQTIKLILEKYLIQ